MDGEQALCTAAVEGLSGGHQFVVRDADTDVLHLAANEGSGGHAGSIGLAPGTGLLTLGGGAVTPQSCRDGRSDESPWQEELDVGLPGWPWASGGDGSCGASLCEGIKWQVF